MNHSEITDADLTVLEQAARAASASPWSLGVSNTATVEEAAAYSSDAVRKGDGAQLWMIVLGEYAEGEGPEEGISPAVTGNGPTSEANARYLVCVQPSNVLLLIAELRKARADLRQARAQLDARIEVKHAL